MSTVSNTQNFTNPRDKQFSKPSAQIMEIKNLLKLSNYSKLEFSNDTTAAAGGIPLGGVYHTSGALKVRIE